MPRTETVPWHEACGRHAPDNSYIGMVCASVDRGVWYETYDLVDGWVRHRAPDDGRIEVLARDPE